MGEAEIPMHLRQPRHPPIDEDCDDMQKITISPVYRGRLEESHQRTARAWRRRPWYMIRYQRFTRDASAFMDNHAHTIFAVLTYTTGAIMILILFGAAYRMIKKQKLAYVTS